MHKIIGHVLVQVGYFSTILKFTSENGLLCKILSLTLNARNVGVRYGQYAYEKKVHSPW